MHATLRAHQDVQRLDVAMDDEARMSVLHGLENLQQQLESLGDR
ncbi:MAG: hypothetical protein WDO56_18660 [Gammaproteobacteria bacterium]